MIAEHPRFSKVLRLAQLEHSIEVLADVNWWASRLPDWTATLQNQPIGQLLYTATKDRFTGFLTVVSGEPLSRRRTISSRRS